MIYKLQCGCLIEIKQVGPTCAKLTQADFGRPDDYKMASEVIFEMVANGPVEYRQIQRKLRRLSAAEIKSKLSEMARKGEIIERIKTSSRGGRPLKTYSMP